MVLEPGGLRLGQSVVGIIGPYWGPLGGLSGTTVKASLGSVGGWLIRASKD